MGDLEGPLYEDSKLKITFLSDAEGNVVSSLDHELWIKQNQEDWDRYIIPRSTLKILVGKNREELEFFLSSHHPRMGDSLRNARLPYEAVGFAAVKAYLESTKRNEVW